MLRKLGKPGVFILGLVLGKVAFDILAEILLMPFDPYLRPVLEQLIPSLGQQIQSIGQQLQETNISLNERDIKTVIQYAASGQIDGTIIIMQIIFLMGLFGAFMFVCMMFRAERRRLMENENSMKLLSKIIVGFFTVVFITISVWAMNELWLSIFAVRVNKVFARNLEIIAPYISLQEERELKSQWALMKTKQEVQAIDDKMFPVMRANGIPVSEKQ